MGNYFKENRNALIFMGAVVGVPLVIGIVYGVLYVSLPYEYYVSSKEERGKLIIELSGEYVRWLEHEKETKGTSLFMGYDNDQRWPMDRVPIIAAINEYIYKKDTFPQQYSDLAPYLEGYSIRDQYRLESDDTEWRLFRTDTDVLVARGN